MIEDLAADLGVQLLEAANLAILLGDQLLAHRGDLDVEIVIREIEIGSEELRGAPVLVPGDGERGRLVIPGDTIEIQEKRKLPLAVVSELGLLR
ncbi:MAG: hypothetical protein WA726_12450 [Acidimicrobiia bacterium]